MTKIKFRGKEYDSLADMPAQVRHDYFKAKAGYDVPEQEPESKTGILPGGFENMPDEVSEIYERVRHKLDAQPTATGPIDKLPRTEDLYRRSAPKGMRTKTTDEILYKPSPPIIKTTPPPLVESDRALQRFLITLVLLLLFAGLALALFFNF